ncbi:MAG: aminotransferase class I/II-fold pyridoxal phosphate-dependent enzyme [Acidobacteriota bacterium]
MREKKRFPSSRSAWSLATEAVHAGRSDFAALGVHAPPLDLSSTYPVADLASGTASLDSLVAGGGPCGSSVYSRLHNPTVARFEDALARLEGAEAAVAFASGMAALTACLMSVTGGDGGGDRRHVVACRPLYGGSDHLLSSGMLGLEVTWAEPDQVAEALRPETALVLIETPANPTLELIDIAAVVRQAGEVPVLVDSTFATPVLQRPLELGARWVLHSATKFLGGHGDVLAGAVATDDAGAAALRQVRLVTGGVLHPLAAYLLHRGLQTLPLRVRAAQQGAQLLAERLAAHPAVERVWYPGLPGGDPAALVGRQMAGPGAIFSFAPRGGFAAAARLMSDLELMTPAVSLGSTDTLIQHPAALTHRVVAEEARRRAGILPAMLRVSVGLESPEDLWRDLEVGLAAGRSATDRVA